MSGVFPIKCLSANSGKHFYFVHPHLFLFFYDISSFMWEDFRFFPKELFFNMVKIRDLLFLCQEQAEGAEEAPVLAHLVDVDGVAIGVGGGDGLGEIGVGVGAEDDIHVV